MRPFFLLTLCPFSVLSSTLRLRCPMYQLNFKFPLKVAIKKKKSQPSQNFGIWNALLDKNEIHNRTSQSKNATWEIHNITDQIRSDQSLSWVRLFATPWITARQASMSIINSWSSLRLTSIESVMPSSHLILCCPLLLLPPIPPSITVFSNESTSHEVAKVLEFQL